MAFADMIEAQRIEAARLEAENERLQAEVADLLARIEAHEAAKGRCGPGTAAGEGWHHASDCQSNEIRWQRQHIASLMELIETLTTEGKKS
jgi:hypothetical protein